MEAAREEDRRGMRTFCDNCHFFFFFFGPVSRFGVAAKQRIRNETITDKTNQVPTFIAETNARPFLRAENKPVFLLPSINKLSLFFHECMCVCVCVFQFQIAFQTAARPFFLSSRSIFLDFSKKFIPSGSSLPPKISIFWFP